MPEISVIIPIYNTESRLDGCIESVVRQTFRDFELILVDDGSTDRSGNICDDWKARDNRIRVIHQENQGRSAARENGTRAGVGEWCCFVDSDDELPSDALHLLSERINDNTDIVFGNGYTLGDACKENISIEDFRHLAVRGEGTIGVPWGSLYRKTLLTPHVFDVPRDFMMGEDYIFWLRIIFSTDKPVAVVREQTYLKGPDSTSSSFIWTSDYAERIQQLRHDTIPTNDQSTYMTDTITDRTANLFAVSLDEPRSIWRQSTFYSQLKADMNACGLKFSLRQNLFLHLPSRSLRRFVSRLFK